MTTTTPQEHRDHIEELRNLSAQISSVVIDVERFNRPAIEARKAAVDYAISVLEANTPGRHLQVIVTDGGESGDAT